CARRSRTRRFSRPAPDRGAFSWIIGRIALDLEPASAGRGMPGLAPLLVVVLDDQHGLVEPAELAVLLLHRDLVLERGILGPDLALQLLDLGLQELGLVHLELL